MLNGTRDVLLVAVMDSSARIVAIVTVQDLTPMIVVVVMAMAVVMYSQVHARNAVALVRPVMVVGEALQL